MTRLYCNNGEHYWTKETRGRPPFNCPEHQEKKAEKPKAKKPKPEPKPEPPKKKREVSETQLEALARGRREAAERKAEAARQSMLKEAERIDDLIALAERNYDKSLQTANKATTPEEIQRLFNISDRNQQTVISLLSRKRYIKRTVGSADS